MSGDSIITSVDFCLTHGTHGISAETESSWQDFLSDTHRGFILAYVEQAQAMEEAAISQ